MRCSLAVGNDRVFGVRMPGDGTLMATLSPSDPLVSSSRAISLRTSCAVASQDLGCSSAGWNSWCGCSEDASLNRQVTEGTYYLVAQGDQDALLKVSGTLNEGSHCDPSLPLFACREGTTCKSDGAELRCLKPTCHDGVDNDGDGATDYPNDPGCSAPEDETEDNLPASTLCSNGLDDDGDGRIDWPSDPGCGSAAGESESGTGESCADPLELTGGTIAVPLSASTADEQNCDGDVLNDRVIGLRFPGWGYLRTYSSPYAIQTLLHACADASNYLNCSSGGVYDYYGPGTYYLQVLERRTSA